MKLLEPIKVGNIVLKNRIMFPPLTTGYEERDGSIGEKSLAFYTRLAKGGVGYIVIGDVAPVNTASPTPKLYNILITETEKVCLQIIKRNQQKYIFLVLGLLILIPSIVGVLAYKDFDEYIESKKNIFNL